MLSLSRFRVFCAVCSCALGCSAASHKPDSASPGALEPHALTVFDSAAIALEVPARWSNPRPPDQPSKPIVAPRGRIAMRFVGDVIFGRYRASGFDPILDDEFDVFAKVRDTLHGDLVVANLETPLVRELPQRNDARARFFGGTKAMATTLAGAGFTTVSVANNHAVDLGLRGLIETPEILAELGLHAVGAANPEGIPIALSVQLATQTRVALLAATTRQNFELPENRLQVPYAPTRHLPGLLGPELERVRSTHDWVIVLLHWGDEYHDRPDSLQRSVARRLIDRGADLVIGHHPHVLQEIEVYRGALIAYSLGNFLFENTQPIPRLSGILEVDHDASTPCEVDVAFHPAVIRSSPSFHPEPAYGGEAELARQRVSSQQSASAPRWQRIGEALQMHYHRQRCSPSLNGEHSDGAVDIGTPNPAPQTTTPLSETTERESR